MQALSLHLKERSEKQIQEKIVCFKKKNTLILLLSELEEVWEAKKQLPREFPVKMPPGFA